MLPWLLAALGSAAWAAFYVAQEDPAYTSDFRHYWKLYWTFGELFRTDAGNWLSHLWTAVRHSEYNPLFTAPLLPFNLVWERARLGYIEAVVLVFMLPAMAVAWTAVRGWLRQAEVATAFSVELTILCGVVLCTSLWIPTLRGYPDVWGLVPLGLAVWWLYATDLARPQRWTTLAAVALCIYAPFLIRKWYAFAVIAVVAAHTAVSVWRLWQSGATRREYGRWVLNHTIIGALVLVLVFTLQGPMVIKALSYGYADAYVAFQRNWAGHAENLLSRYGLLMPLFCLSGWWLALRTRHRIAAVYAYLALCLALTVALFVRVQGLDTHHHLPVGLFLCLMTGLSIGMWAQALRAQPVRMWLLLLAVWVAAAANFAKVFVPTLQFPSAFILQDKTFAPLKLGNMEAYTSLASFIKHDVAPSQRISIFASNHVLSQTMLENFLTDEDVRKIAPMAEVDEYEGFNLRPLYSEYVVAPSQPLVVDAKHQKVVYLPAEMLLQGRTIGAAYKEVRRISVASDLQFVVFQKTRAFKPEELQAFLNEFSHLRRPDGYAYTPMQLALLGTEVQVHSAGDRPHRIDMNGAAEWVLQLPPKSTLTLAPGFWPGWLPAAPQAGASATPAGEDVIFSVQLLADRVAQCLGSAPRMEVRLDDRLLLSKVFNTPLVEFFKVSRADFSRLKIRVEAGDGPGCDQILIDHRTD